MKFVTYLRSLFGRPAPRIIVLPAALATPLDHRARLELRDWLALAATQRALGLMEARHPGLQTARLGKIARSEWDQIAVVNYLNRIAGWEAFRNGLLALPEAPATTASLSESYPEQS